jgi:hypothetical protein
VVDRTAAPLVEKGHPSKTSHSWWSEAEETVPELIWPWSISVYRRMIRSDAQIASVIRAVCLPVLRTGWWIEPNGASDEVTEHVALDLGLDIKGAGTQPKPRRMRDRFSWQEHARLALTEIVYGHSFFEQLYRPDESNQRLHLRKLGWRAPSSISRINVAPDGGLVSIEQDPLKPGDKEVVLDVSRLVAYAHDREGGNWQGNSLLRPAYKHWLVKDRLIRVQAQTIDRNGMGIPVYTGADGETDLNNGLRMATSYRSGESAGAAIPFGATLKLQGVDGTMPDAGAAIQYHDEQIARAVLAHFLNLGRQTGSWALGTTFADFFTMSLQTLAQQLADVATQHIVEDLVDVNWGEDEPAPRIVFDEIGSRQVADAKAMKTLADAGILFPDRALEEAARQQYGLPPKDWSGFKTAGSTPNTPPESQTVPNTPTPDSPEKEPTEQGDGSVANNSFVPPPAYARQYAEMRRRLTSLNRLLGKED